jgi:hypothetical protein
MRWEPGAQLELAALVGDQRGLGVGVVLAFDGQRNTVELAGGRDDRDLHAPPRGDPLGERAHGPGALDADQAASTSIPRACAEPALVIRPWLAGCPPD